ncbi:MAG: hypothetical protein V1781_03930 [Bacteroidota bacterium]
MKTKSIFIVAICIMQFAFISEINAQNVGINTTSTLLNIKEIPYTLDDRDRIIRLEVHLEAIDDKFRAIDDKIDKLYTLIYFVLGGVFGLIGLIMWDRRSYIKPVKEDIKQLQMALREFAKKTT